MKRRCKILGQPTESIYRIGCLVFRAPIHANFLPEHIRIYVYIFICKMRSTQKALCTFIYDAKIAANKSPLTDIISLYYMLMVVLLRPPVCHIGEASNLYYVYSFYAHHVTHSFTAIASPYIDPDLLFAFVRQSLENSDVRTQPINYYHIE